MDAETLNRPLHILHLEDDANDHLLVSETLAADGLECELDQARSRLEFTAAIGRRRYDLIISDYTLPAYDGLTALARAREAALETPFVFFSGTIGEEVAVEGLKRGATDYVLKQRPGRLVAAVRRALLGAAERQRLKQIEDKMREQAALLDKAHDAFVVCGLDWRIEFWNAGAERLYGWTATEALGQNLQQFLFASRPPAAAAAMTRSLADLGEWTGELEQTAKDGRQLIVRSRGTVIRNDDNSPKSLLLINADITEHKQLEEQFLRAQRLESLGALVSGIAHDLNNTLVPITIGVEILRDEPLSESAAAIVHTMGASARRSADMIRQMLVFARGGEAGKQHVYPGRLLKEMARVIAGTFPKHIQCRLSLGPDLYSVHCVPTQMHQVLMNLSVNARDAMPERGVLTLAAHNVTLSGEDAAGLPGARAGNFLCLSVADTGAGIPPEQMSALFRPFFTTKAPGKGTGLGLSTCQAIVKKHGGFITVCSQVQAGTEFRVYLPAAETKPDEPPPVISNAPPAGNGERVLVVDDEEAVLAMTRAVLENYGYAVSTATNGLEAMGLFRERTNEFKLAIVDQSMPILGARALITALRKIRPEVRIILTSGLEEEAAESAVAGSDGFLAKPFSSESLLIMAHDVLNVAT